MAISVEEYGKIRYLKEIEGLSQRAVAERLGMSRNTVKRYWYGNVVPWERKEGSGRKNDVITDEVRAFVTACLVEDEESGLKKQKHTARRIYDRLVDEHDFHGCESSIRTLVAELKQQPKNAFVPLEYYPGEAIQVDWGEATVFLSGEKTKINLWCMRECYSDDFFCCAFYRQNEESFLEGMRAGLEHFSGVPRKIIFDNARVAVKEGFGVHAKVTERYLAMASHYAFKPVFCNIASGNEKGLVEGLVGFVRRNALVPVPRVKNIEELNIILLNVSLKYRDHTIKGKLISVGESVPIYQSSLTPLPPFRFDITKTLQLKVDSFALVRFDFNKYSVPYVYSGKTVTAKGSGNIVRFLSNNIEIASFPRDYGRGNIHYELNHYMELLTRKPRSIYNAAPVRRTVPPMMMNFLEKLQNPKELVGTLRLYLQYGDKILDKLDGISSYTALEAKLITVVHSAAKESVRAEIKVVVPTLCTYDVLMRDGVR